MKSNKLIKIYIIATEPSGDVIGSNLIKSFKKEKDINVRFYGVGGHKMIKSGLVKSLFPIEELSIFGLFEVFPKIYKVFKLLKKTENDLLQKKPNFLITIDSPDFNFRILKRISNKIPLIKKIHYVAPTVWAWRSGRAKHLANYVDKLITILPFEKKYFTKYHLETKFVGHPVFDLNNSKKANIKNLYKKYNIKKNTYVISCLPGSRLSELKRSLPVLIKSMQLLKEKTKKNIHILFYILPHLIKSFQKFKFNFNYSLVVEKDKYKCFKISDVAVSTSGTAALELSYFKIPTIVIYKLNLFSYFLAKIFVRVKYANLLNIIEKKYIIPEFLQFKCRPDLISFELLKLLSNKNYSKKQISNAQKALNKLRSNNKLPSVNVVKEII